jgi:hypothetical protein
VCRCRPDSEQAAAVASQWQSSKTSHGASSRMMFADSHGSLLPDEEGCEPPSALAQLAALFALFSTSSN